MFKRGDRVRLINIEQIVGEWDEWDITYAMEHFDAKIGDVFEVGDVKNNKEIQLNMRLEGFYLHPCRFELAKLTNEERMRRRKEELCLK